MREESLPRLENYLDYRTRRADLLALRAALPDIRESAYSDDGLIGVTLGGRGEIVDLLLDERLYRVTDSRRLAGNIGATVRAANTLVRTRRSTVARGIALDRERRVS
jgi:DNA-binding protein YbaB